MNDRIKILEERLFYLEDFCRSYLQKSEENEYYKYLKAGQRKEVLRAALLMDHQVDDSKRTPEIKKTVDPPKQPKGWSMSWAESSKLKNRK